MKKAQKLASWHPSSHSPNSQGPNSQRPDNQHPDDQHPDNQKGFTMQTLVITAVLVLMAVVAGVVIVALVANATEDLENQASDLEGACEPWEIHDPVMEARGIGGPNGYGGVESSAIGCLRVCYIISIDPGFPPSFPAGTGVQVGLQFEVIFMREAPEGAERSILSGVVVGSNEIVFLQSPDVPIPFIQHPFEFKVSGTEDRCEIYNPETGKVNDYPDLVEF